MCYEEVIIFIYIKVFIKNKNIEKIFSIRYYMFYVFLLSFYSNIMKLVYLYFIRKEIRLDMLIDLIKVILLVRGRVGI